MRETASALAERPPERRPLRVQLRGASTVYLARLLTEPTPISCLNGTIVQGQIGDVVISYENGVAITVTSAADYERSYQIVEQPSGLALSAESLSRLAKVLRFGATANERDFVQAVESLAKVAIGGVDVHFTPGQIADLKTRADKRGLPYDVYVKRIVDHVLQEFWTSKSE
jgi:hypothetical protein